MLDESLVIVLIGTFLLAGMVKGIIGLGLPTVSLAILSAVTELPNAMALLLVPSLLTNLWQALAGRHTKAILARIWPFLLMASGMVWVGTLVLVRVDLTLLTALLGVLLMFYASISLAGFRFTIANRHETWVGPLAGVFNGILTGMTGSFVVPGVLFLQALGLARDRLIQAMGMLFTVSTLALAIALGSNNLLTLEQGVWSLLAVAPALVGMVLGRKLRRRLSERVFRRVFFSALFVIGGYLVATHLQQTSSLSVALC